MLLGRQLTSIQKYYYYYYVELVPARATTVLHCPLFCVQECISSRCSSVSLIRVSMKVPEIISIKSIDYLH